MGWLLVTLIAISLLAVALVLALGVTVRRAPSFDRDAEAAALAGLSEVEGPSGEPFFPDADWAVELTDALERAESEASGPARS